VREYQTTPFVEANAGQLGQVFVNLLVNAAQAIGASHGGGPGEIVIRTWTDDGGRAVVEVSDSGPGIPAAVQRRIFDPFFTTKAVGEGSGLGLSISHAIVQSHGGQISVESRPGRGATFRVALPPAPGRTTAKSAHSLAPAAPGRGRILAIDDEPAIGRAMSRLLGRGHDVFVVTDARVALERIANGESFDVILCDLMMPTMTGMDLHEALREVRPDLAQRVVFVTGGTFTARQEEFLRTVPNPTLTKPVDPTTLRRVVADYVVHSKLRVRESD
jgi:CheY-like chemotaxis protein